MIVLENLDEDNLEIKLDVFFAKDNTVNETIDVENNFESILDDIVHIVEEYGYTEMARDKSPYSTSLYVTFCDEDEFNSQTVELVTRMRVSSHKLKKHKYDRTYQDAVNRQLNDLQSFANTHKDLNKNLSDEDNMPISMLYVMYENEFYTKLDDLYSKIRKRVAEFKNRHSNK